MSYADESCSQRHPLLLSECCIESIKQNIQLFCGGVNPLSYLNSYGGVQKAYRPLSTRSDDFYRSNIHETMEPRVNGPFECLPAALRQDIIQKIDLVDFRHMYFLVDETVRVLHATNIHVWHSSSTTIAKFLSLRCKNLHELKLGSAYCKIPASVLSSGFSTMTKLQKLHLTDRTVLLDDSVFDTIGQTMVHLVELVTGGNCHFISDNIARLLLPDNKNRPGCLKLKYISCAMSHSAVSLLLQGLPDLEVLDCNALLGTLIFMVMDTSNKELLRPAVIFHESINTMKLRKLYLRPDFYLYEQGEEGGILKVLSTMTSFREIDVLCHPKNGPVNDMVRPIVIRQGQNIETLSLSFLHEDGFNEVMRTIMVHCTKLKTLSIAFFDYGDIYTAIAEHNEFVYVNGKLLSALEEISLEFCDMDVDDANMLQHVLAVPTLKKFMVHSLHGMNVQWLRQVLNTPHNKGDKVALNEMTHLTLAHCPVSKKFMMAFIQSMPKLQDLLIYNCMSSEIEVEELKCYALNSGIKFSSDPERANFYS